MWWMGLVAAVAALPIVVRLCRRRAERQRIDRIRVAVECSLSALKQPDGSPRSGVVDPPTSDSVSPSGSAVRPLRRVVLGVLDLGTTLAPRRVA